MKTGTVLALMCILMTYGVFNSPRQVITAIETTFPDLNKTPATSSRILDKSGYSVVSWYEHDGTSTNVYVKRWSGKDWELLGNSFLDANKHQNVSQPQLTLDKLGNPIVSWKESDGNFENIYVKRWTGKEWILLGTFPDFSDSRFDYLPSFSLDQF